jgi:hypothetical protein
MAISTRLAEHANEGHNEELIALVVAGMQDPVTPIFEAALAGKELHDAGRVIARLSKIVDHGAAAIDENLLRVRAVEIYLGHVQPPSNATVPHDTGALDGGLSTEPGKRNGDCFFDLHVGPPGLRLFNGTPISARTRGRVTMARRLSSMTIKKKITSRHGVDSRPLSE